jgi:glycosyltransferase involved in cell wall biosynthesis
VNTKINQIAFLCHPYHRGGVTKWMVDAAREIANRGFKVYFITVEVTTPFISSGNKPTILSLIKSISNLNIISTPVNFFFELGTMEYRSSVYATLIKNHLPEGVSIIVSDDYTVWHAASVVASRNPMVGVLHGDDSNYYNLAAKYYSNVSILIAVSERIKKNCSDLLLEKSPPIKVIPCGIPLPDLKEQKKMTSDTLQIVWAGRIEEKTKRVSDLIKISIKLKHEGFLFKLNIIGEGPKSEWLKSEIIKNNLSDVIAMHGWQDSNSVHDKMQNCDLFLMTSNSEGMSVAVMEALANGCGIVSSHVSGVEDLINHSLSKKCIWIYPIGDTDRAIDLIKQSQKISKADRFQAARQIAELEFSINSCMATYINTIKHLETKTSISVNKIKIISSPALAFARFLKYFISIKF